jgi:hypothetical protein
MEFREIVELAKQRGLQAGKISHIDMIAAFENDIIYSRDNFIFEDNEDNNTGESERRRGILQRETALQLMEKAALRD